MEKFITNVKKTFKKHQSKLWPPGCTIKIRPKLAVREFQGASQQSFLPISYGELFKVEPTGIKLVQKIVVEGKAGIGKTTFCVSLCEDWAKGKLFQQFGLLLFIPLHYKKLGSAHSLSEMLKLLHPSEKEKVCDSVASDIKQSRGSNVLIIADGWDNLGESEQKEESILWSLLFGSKYSNLSVLLTVRSSLFSTLLRKHQSCIDQLVKIQGLSKGDITEFIQSQLATDKKAYKCDLLDELESNPLLEIACSVPLNCAVVCHLCRTMKDKFPTTMTELYTKMTLNIVFSNLQKKKHVETACTFNDSIPKELQQSWRLLCDFAFQTILKDHTIFYREELTAFFPLDISLSKTILHFGMLVPSMQLVETDSFQFLHPTLQKFLAALHLVMQSAETQLALFKRYAKMNCLNTMWRFFFGLYFTELELYNESNIKQALQVIHLSNKDNVQLCHCAFEARRIDVSNEVVKLITKSTRGVYSKIIFGYVHTSYDCATVISIISAIQKHTNIEISLNRSLRKKQIRELETTLSEKENQLQVIALDLSYIEISDMVASKFFCSAPAVFQSLEKLYLSHNSVGAECIKSIMIALGKSSMPTLTQLDLSFNPIPLHGLHTLHNAVSSGTLANLEILFLQQSLTDDADINVKFLSTFVETLSCKCQSLRRLNLFANDIGEPGTPAITKIISCLTSIRKEFDLRLNREYMSEVEDNFVAVMEQSIRDKGTIDYTSVHGVIVGPGRSGKNSLMRRLMNERPLDPNVVSPSTGVLERVVKIEVKKLCTVAAAVNNVNWRKLDYDEEALELMMTTAKSFSTSQCDPITVFDDFCEEVTPDLKEYLLYSQMASEESISGGHSSSESVILTNISSDIHILDPKMDDYARPLDIFKHAVKLQHMDALREHLESSWSLYLTNTGGQMEFQELLPLLVRGPSVFFITFPLNMSLNECYTVRYQYPDGSENTYQSPYTLMEEILQTLATIAALDFTGPHHKIRLMPKVFFIGTHKDQLPLSEAEKIIEKIDQQLCEKIIHTSLYQRNSIEFAHILPHKKLMFTVNNLEEADDDFQMIRSALQRCVETTPEFKIRCPSTWLVFSLILRAQYKSRQVLTYNNCFTIAQSCGISDRIELNNALFFIHTRLGLIRYFSVKGLNTLIVIDPQILFDIITKLIITETFVAGNTSITEIDQFQEMGIFSLDTMKRIYEKDHSSSVITFEWIMKLLNYLRIATFFTDHKGCKKCFFPSILCRVNKQISMPPLSCRPINPPSLLIGFQNGFCPRGIHGALITYLASNEMQSEVSWNLRTKRIYKNQVSFEVGPGDITLKQFSTHLDISFDCESGATTYNEIMKTCHEAYKQIKYAMKDVTSRYNKGGCRYYFTFYCTREECKRFPHPAEVDWDIKKLRCKQKGRQSDFPHQYEIWTTKSNIFLYEEAVNQIIDFSSDGVSKHLGQIADLMTEWEGPIAEELGLNPSIIAGIKVRHPTELKLQVRAALEQWKQSNGDNATYHNLTRVFERAGCQEYANKVKEIVEDLCSEQISDSDDSRPPAPSHLPPPPSELPVFPVPTRYIVVSRENASQDSSVVSLPSHFKVDEIHPGNVVSSAFPAVKPIPLVSQSQITDMASSSENVVGDLDVFIAEISKHICYDWKFLARPLGFEQTDIDAIEYKDMRNLREQIFQMFHEWKRKEGIGATTARLLAAIEDAELQELLRTLREKGFVVPSLRGSADIASSLAAGVRYPIQATDDTQRDSPAKLKIAEDDQKNSPAKLKTAAKSPPAPAPAAQAAQTQGGSTPPSERDLIRQKRLQQFASDTSDKFSANPIQHDVMERTMSAGSVQSPLLSPSMAALKSKFEVGDMIQVDRPDSAPWYGVVRWIGTLPGSSCHSAGIEMEINVQGGGPGSFQGIDYFNCSDGHGLFLPVSHLKRDNRFAEIDAISSEAPTSSSSQDSEPSQPGRSASTPKDRLRNLFQKLGMQDDIGVKQPSASVEDTGSKAFELQIPADRAGLVIGTGGMNIREVERLTNTIIKVDRGLGLLGGENRRVVVVGSEENCKKALLIILKHVKRRVDEHTAGVKTITVPDSSVGRIIGKGGSTISAIKSISGAQEIKFDEKKAGFEALLQTERSCYIHGSEEAIEKAERLIRLAMTGEDIVAGATFAAIFMELLKTGVQCQEERS